MNFQYHVSIDINVGHIIPLPGNMKVTSLERMSKETSLVRVLLHVQSNRNLCDNPLTLKLPRSDC